MTNSQMRTQLDLIFPGNYSDVWVVSDSKQMIIRLLTSGYLNNSLNPSMNSGDMTKAIYDPDQNDIIDVSERSNTQEDNLGDPDQDDYILTSDAAGIRSWIPMPVLDEPGYIQETGETTYTPDFKDNFFDYTITADSIFADPINIQPGMNGTIIVRQDTIGDWLATWGAFYVFPEGTPVLDPSAGWVHIFEYRCISATEVVMEFTSSYLPYVAPVIKRFEMIVTSPVEPVYDFDGIEVDMVDNGDRTYTYSSGNIVTKSKSTGKTETSVQVIIAMDITDASLFWYNCTNLTYFDTSGLTSVTKLYRTWKNNTSLTSFNTNGLTSVTTSDLSLIHI